MALGPKDASDGGTVVFGGVDTGKFSGRLHQFANLPPQTEQGQPGPWRYWIQLDGVSTAKPGSKSGGGGGGTYYPGSSLPVVLDTGSTISYLPQSVIDGLAADFGAETLDDGTLAVDCGTAQQSGSVDFVFGALTVRVPYHEFVWEAAPGQCLVGAAPVTTSTTALLGDTFLRRAYVLFDQDNANIFLAQYENCGTQLETLPAGAGSAANLTGQCSASNAAAGLGVGSGVVWTVALGVVVQAVFFAL